MLSLLKERYNYLCKARFDDAKKIEEKLTAHKDQHYDELIIPNAFFCTFMEGKGMVTALKLGKIDCGDDQEIKVSQARNPSDTLWLNMGVERKEQIKDGIIVAFIILVLALMSTFVFVVVLDIQSYINYRANPPMKSCSEIIANYDYPELKLFAYLEYAYLETTPDFRDLNDKISQTGALPCFC